MTKVEFAISLVFPLKGKCINNPEVGTEYIGSSKVAVISKVSVATRVVSEWLWVRVTFGEFISIENVILSTDVSSPFCIPEMAWYGLPARSLPPIDTK